MGLGTKNFCDPGLGRRCDAALEERPTTVVAATPQAPRRHRDDKWFSRWDGGPRTRCGRSDGASAVGLDGCRCICAYLGWLRGGSLFAAEGAAPGYAKPT